MNECGGGGAGAGEGAGACFVLGESGDPWKSPPKAWGELQESSLASATVSSPEARRLLSWPLTLASDGHYGAGEPELAACLSPSPGGNLKGRTDWVHIRPSNRVTPAFRSAASSPQESGALQALGFPIGVPWWGAGAKHDHRQV